MTTTFNAEQVLTLDRAWLLAQSLVAEAFRLDFGDFRAWPVDIKRYPELAPEELAEGVFAQLFRYLRPGLATADYYRVCLYDPAILEAVASEPGLELEPLLLYILTHEFIHVARFATFMELFSATEKDRAAEEEIVHRETFRLLAKVPGLERVLNLYKNHRLPVD